MSAPQAGDKSAGFTGLILGAIAIFVIVFGIVRWTNAQYAGKHEGGAAPAGDAAPAAAPAPAGH
jgi:hypothetical protein